MATYVQISLNVISSADNSPISGAKVFIDGTINFDPNQFSVQTDSNGNAQFQVVQNLGNHVLQVTAGGFAAGNTLVNTVSSLPQFVQLKLIPTAVSSSIIEFQFIPQQTGITWQLQQGISTIDSGASQADGTSFTNHSIQTGTYTMVANLTGYATLTQSFSVNGQDTPYTFTLIQNPVDSQTQQGNTGGNSTTLTTTPTSVVSQVLTTPPVSSEYIYPNTDYDKYFTITGARIYIGNLFIDECNSVQYALQDNAVPVYGYASRFPDAYGQGRSLVQGQLTINFVTEGYLFTVLQQYKQLITNKNVNGSTIGTPSSQTINQILGLMNSRDTLTQQANSSGSGPTATSLNNQAAQLQTQISGLVNGLSPSDLDTLNASRTQQLKTFTDVIGFDNPIYQDVLFDLRVELGNEVTGVKRVRYIEKCKLISNEQVIAPDGQTILDSYGFIGRRLR